MFAGAALNLRNCGGGSIVLTGVRKEESVKRAKRREFEVLKHKFSGNFTEFEQWQEQQRVKHLKASVNQDKFSSNKKSEVRCINGKDRIVINPILEWTNRDVWEFLNSVVRVPHCELYDQGFTRIGCIGCPMASRRERINQLNRYPYVKQKWLEVLRKMPLKKYDMTAEEVLEWWLSNQSLSQYAQSLNQTTIDYNEYDTQ